MHHAQKRAGIYELEPIPVGEKIASMQEQLWLPEM